MSVLTKELILQTVTRLACNDGCEHNDECEQHKIEDFLRSSLVDFERQRGQAIALAVAGAYKDAARIDRDWIDLDSHPVNGRWPEGHPEFVAKYGTVEVFEAIEKRAPAHALSALKRIELEARTKGELDSYQRCFAWFNSASNQQEQRNVLDRIWAEIERCQRAQLTGEQESKT